MRQKFSHHQTIAATALFAYLLSQLLFGLIAATGEYASGERALELDRCYVEVSFDYADDTNDGDDDHPGITFPSKPTATACLGSQQALALNARAPLYRSPRSLPPTRAPPRQA